MWVAATLAVGAAGGSAFFAFGLPLPWLLGAMIATTLVALAGAPLRASPSVRNLVMVVLGVMLGGTFSPEMISHVANWTTTIGILLVYVAIVAAILFAAYLKFTRFNRPTAFFSAAPGGFGEMVALCGLYGGDMRAVSLVHSVRILMTVFLIALWFKMFEGYVPGGSANVAARLSSIALDDAMILIGCGIVGFAGARVLRIPAGPLLGPMAASAVVHLLGLTAAQPPQTLIAASQVVIGASAGCRFTGIRLRDVVGAAAAGALSTAFMLATAASCAYFLAPLVDATFPVLLLAFSPGGLAEMCLISLSLGIDTAFVSTHHSARLIFLVVCLPFVFRYVFNRATSDKTGSAD